mmetsp:Transcript_38597/g.62530  ORF Transcript_38597/g.62530 Transcript_38597/m.62530 type:complete len:634 (+) Transcript_38597:65-1966(+)
MFTRSRSEHVLLCIFVLLSFSRLASAEYKLYADAEKRGVVEGFRAHIQTLLESKRYDNVSEVLLDVIGTLATVQEELTPASANEVADALLDAFRDEGYHPSLIASQKLAAKNAVISDLVACSDRNTTDEVLAELSSNLFRNYPKVLALWNSRSRLKFNRDLLRAISHEESLQWAQGFLAVYDVGSAEESSYANLKEHVRWLLQTGHGLDYSMYFSVTYIDEQSERALKNRINQNVRKALENTPVFNQPNPKKLAVASGFWRPHPVLDTLGNFIKALRPHYDLTLIMLGNKQAESFVTEDFERVVVVRYENETLDLAQLNYNEFAMIIYADIGMNVESVALSNIRLAPVQIMLSGHPVSTYGGEIDYFVSGVNVEASDGWRHYSERLFLLPGLGTAFGKPTYIPPPSPSPSLKSSSPVLSGPLPYEPMIINLAWTACKINYPLLTKMARIINTSKRRILLRFFPALDIGRQLCALRKAIGRVIPQSSFEVYASVAHEEYVRKLAEGHMFGDSYQFAGVNTLYNAFALRMPYVTQVGYRLFSRWGANMLIKLGAPELIATTEDEYVSLVLRMANEDDFYVRARAKFLTADMDALVFTPTAAPYFKSAVDYLLDQHQELAKMNQSEPIVWTSRSRT